MDPRLAAITEGWQPSELLAFARLLKRVSKRLLSEVHSSASPSRIYLK